MSSIAVIDIGTNTINLLIARAVEGGFETEHFVRIPAKLGQGGMTEGVLTEAAMNRGLVALASHLDTCKTYDVGQIKVTATSAVRSASNGRVFVARVQADLGLSIEVIAGTREAELIWKGIALADVLEDSPSLIMDIGGGSTEFILANAHELLWLKSYDLGVTRLQERFHAPDPFRETAEAEMKNELKEDLSDLWAVIGQYQVEVIIGASGSFNSLDAMLNPHEVEPNSEVKRKMDLTAYQELSHKLRRTDRAGRAQIPGLSPDRIDTMPYSALLIDILLEHMEAKLMWRCSYALKEGLLSELLS